MFVNEQPAKVPAARRKRLLAAHLDELLVAAWKLGSDRQELLTELESRAAKFYSDTLKKEPKR